ncbi:MAG: hypothetical protein OXH78_00855 [Acidimicrobiaceae bacterium]|nr:hypothetical protein [Acidimicrobiaceae bacterium]
MESTAYSLWTISALLDANAYSMFMRGHKQVNEIVRSAEELLLSTVVVGELLYGFRRGSRFDQNAENLRTFIGNPHTTLFEAGPRRSTQKQKHRQKPIVPGQAGCISGQTFRGTWRCWR